LSRQYWRAVFGDHPLFFGELMGEMQRVFPVKAQARTARSRRPQEFADFLAVYAEAPAP
jgi:selenophosphate synthetase-related protein